LWFSLFIIPILLVAQHHGRYLPSKPLIVIDAGHGGRDIGAKVAYPFCEEKRLALSTALLAKKYLDQLGYKVILTRSKDNYLPLSSRVALANQSKCELFVSIHFNSCKNTSAHGIEAYYVHKNPKHVRTIASYNLAKFLLQKVTHRTKARSRGIKKGNFFVIRNTNMPAVLFEAGFITNLAERKKLRQQNYLEQLAKGIAEGVDDFVLSRAPFRKHKK